MLGRNELVGWVIAVGCGDCARLQGESKATFALSAGSAMRLCDYLSRELQSLWTLCGLEQK